MDIRIRVTAFIWLLFSSVLAHSSTKNEGESYLPCQYTPRSINKTTLAGKSLSQGVNFSLISEVGSIMAGNPSALPLEFMINLDVFNPNSKHISLQELDYILRVDNVELTRGTFKKKFKLSAGKTRSVPLPVSIDIASLLRTNSAGAIQNMVKNFMGTGTRATNVTLQIRPSYKAGKQQLPESRYIPVSFSFQVKK